MADKHPYVSSQGALRQVLDKLRKSFPTTLNADVLKKLDLAPSNESFIINIVRFLGLVDDAGARTDSAQQVFTLHDDPSFQKAFSEVVKTAYSDLLLHPRRNAWSSTEDQLIPFFRQTNQSSQLIGTRQANTFRVLASYAGHGAPLGDAKPTQPKRKSRAGDANRAKSVVPVGGGSKLNLADLSPARPPNSNPNLALTVRIEINLPATGDQDTYDKIFKSIRENLLNG